MSSHIYSAFVRWDDWAQMMKKSFSQFEKNLEGRVGADDEKIFLPIWKKLGNFLLSMDT